jgi:hypothetical protein
VRHTAIAGQLPLGGLDILKQREAFEERIVLADIDQDGGAASMLRENDWTSGALEPSNDSGELGAELGQRLDVSSEVRNGHRDSPECVPNTVHIGHPTRKPMVAA